jgi:hypothetical protein
VDTSAIQPTDLNRYKTKAAAPFGAAAGEQVAKNQLSVRAAAAANFKGGRQYYQAERRNRTGHLRNRRQGHGEGDAIVEKVTFRIKTKGNVVIVVDIVLKSHQFSGGEVESIIHRRGRERMLKELRYCRRATDKRWNNCTVGEVVHDVADRGLIERMILKLSDSRMCRRIHKVNEEHIRGAIPVSDVRESERRAGDLHIAQIDIADIPRVTVVVIEIVEINRIRLEAHGGGSCAGAGCQKGKGGSAKDTQKEAIDLSAHIFDWMIHLLLAEDSLFI